MQENNRRSFLKRSATVLASAAAGLHAAPAEAAAVARTAPDPALLSAVAEAVLPSEIGAAGVRRVTRDFQRWMDGFEPVAELEHAYGPPNEIEYGPPDPAPRWGAQLEALDLEARRRLAHPFAELPLEQRRELLRRQLRGDAASRFPEPAQAEHVAMGLLAFYFARPEATDLCYRAMIRKETCRGLETAPDMPRPLQSEAGA
jgi:hypothetical protein